MALADRQLVVESAGRGSRLRFGSQFAISACLFAILAFFLMRLSEFSLVRVRGDWTRSAENSLDPTALGVLAQLPEEVTVDVFFRAVGFPLEELASKAQERVLRLLYVIRDASGGRVRLVQHELAAGRADERTQSRLNELGTREVEPGGMLGISAGKRHALVKLWGEVADFDLGDPLGQQGPARPPSMVNFRGEEALVNALMKVARTDSPSALFTTGHGEYDPQSGEILGLSNLKAALEADGFVVGTWDAQKTPEVPDDCRVLASIGPVQPFAPAELAAIRRYVERGGRMICATGPDPLPADNSLATLLSPWGLEIAPRGIVCRGQLDVTGQQQFGTNACGHQLVDASGLYQHPITEQLRRSGRRVAIANAHALAVGHGLPGSTVLQVLRSADGSWLDLPLEGANVGDWQQQATERRGPFVLGAAILFPPQQSAGPPLRASEDGRAEARVFAFGAAASMVNVQFELDRELFLNAFNWAAAREWRVSVRQREREERRLDLQDAERVSRAHLWIVWVPPLVSLLLGLWTAWRRRR
jgi:hypothetical protein